MTATMAAPTIARVPRRETVEDPLLLAAIRAVRAGDENAFEQVVVATQRRVTLLCWRLLGDEETAKDARQDAFVRAYRHLRRYDERRPFMGWLYRIVVNVCRSHLKKRRKQVQVFTDLSDVDPAAADDLDGALVAKQERQRLDRAIDALPVKEREALILCKVEELPTEEVAMILGCRPATVRVHVHNARAKLHKLMER